MRSVAPRNHCATTPIHAGPTASDAARITTHSTATAHASSTPTKGACATALFTTTTRGGLAATRAGGVLFEGTGGDTRDREPDDRSVRRGAR